MKITTFNSDGSIKDVNEHHFQIPDFITSFDSNHSFLNITDDRMIILDEDRDMERENLLTELIFLINYDIANYASCIEIKKKESNNAGRSTVLIKTSNDTAKQDALNRLFRTFMRTSNEPKNDRLLYEKKNKKELLNNLNVSNVVEFLEYNVIYPIRYRSETEPINYLLNLIHWFYYAIDKQYKIGNLTNEGEATRWLLYPFANLKGNGFTKYFYLKLIESLYNLNEKHREELYSIILMIESLGYSNNREPSLNHHTLSMMQNFNGLTRILDAEPSSEYENIRLELEKEEFVTLHVQCDVSEEIKTSIKSVLDKQYEKFCNINGDFIKLNICNKAMRLYKYDKKEYLTKKDWYGFYCSYLDELETEYKRMAKDPEELECPYYYYYLLVTKFELGDRYDFNGELLDCIILRTTKRKGEKKADLYDQMYRLNFMEESANAFTKKIPNNDTFTNVENGELDDKTKKELDEYKDNLLKGKNRKIACDIERGDFKIDSDNSTEYAMVWLEPLFKLNLNKEIANEDEFRKKFEAVIKDAQIKDYLISRRKRIVVKHNLNIKLLLNIVGYLANEGKNINKNYVEYRVGAKLEKEIAYFWNIKRGTRSYHKYVSGYETGDSDLSQKIIKILQSSFN